MRASYDELTLPLHAIHRLGAPDAEWLGEEVRWALAAGLLPRQAAFDERLREGFGADTSATPPPPPPSGDTPVPAAPAPAFNFQRKVLSASAASEAGGGATSPPQLARVLTGVTASGRRCQPLVVVASLVDRVPNLGGLARTCEILGGARGGRRAAAVSPATKPPPPPPLRS